MAYSKFRHRGSDRGLPSRVGMLVTYAPALVSALTSFAGRSGRPACPAPCRRAYRALPQTCSRAPQPRPPGPRRRPALPGRAHLRRRHPDNFYHHYLLSRLRAGGDGDGKGYGYKIPRGGLFELVTCPHYLFEIIVFLGFAMIAQTVFTLAVAVSMTSYLSGRSCTTRRWYAVKFEEFPARVKTLVPYVL
ncbi:hypothetical protein EJB05_15015, partial [Eragrostis curvula]